MFGLSFGYLGVWADHMEWVNPNNNVTWWEDFLPLFSIPGTVIAQIHWDYDWCIDEGWDYRWPITVFNGLFWMIFIPVFSFYVYLARCHPRDLKLAYQKYSRTKSDHQHD